VLAIARTITSANRLLEVLHCLRDDPRVRVVFTVVPGSAFRDGVRELLHTAGARIVPWTAAVRTPFDLALSASDNGELHRVKAPLMLIPHGVGYHRFAVNGVSGLARTALVHNDHALPAAVVVTHPGQIDQLAGISPELRDRAVVAGDPCLDQIAAGQRQLDRYRDAFRLGDRDLVVVSSTWGRHSLLGRQHRLVGRLVTELPYDRYRVAAVLHPNIWSRYGAWQVRAWLRRALDAGLILLPPQQGWQAAIIAASVVVSDHGSLTCYAIAAGKPVLLAEDGGPQVVPGSPMDLIRTSQPRLTPDQPLTGQIEDAIRDHQPQRAADIAKTIFSAPHASVEVLRDSMYRLMGLPKPAWPATAPPVTIPVPNRLEPSAFAVYGRLDTPDSVTVQRYPVAIEPEWREDHPGVRHLAVYDSESDARLRETAAVHLRREVSATEAVAIAWADRTLTNYAGARLAAAQTPDVIVARLRIAARRVTLRIDGAAHLDPMLIVGAVYTRVVSGKAPDLTPHP
jgi:hypothetical protein